MCESMADIQCARK